MTKATAPRKRSRLQNLPDGTYFVIPSLEKVFKNLHIVKVGSCSVRVAGYSKEDPKDEVWTPFSNFFACNTEVYPVDADEMDKADLPKRGRKPKSTEDKEVKSENKTRGRKKKHNVTIPKTPFTVKELAKKLNVKPYVINNEMNRLRATGVVFVEEKKKKQQGKGKPACVWKIKE